MSLVPMMAQYLLGSSLGSNVGSVLGSSLGSTVGLALGDAVGALEGPSEAALEGDREEAGYQSLLHCPRLESTLSIVRSDHMLVNLCLFKHVDSLIICNG